MTTFWEIVFKSDGDYRSYDEMVEGALNDDCYQKIYPGIGSEILLESLLKFVQDIDNRPTRDGVDHGTLYKKDNGRQIDSSRRYYLVKEPNSDEFNLYVKITKGRNLGYYRVYTSTSEVKLLIQYGLNYLKQNARLPIIADYLQFSHHYKYFIARERCELISRLLNNNVVVTTKTFRVDYDVKELGTRHRKAHKKSKANMPATTTSCITSVSTSPPCAHKRVLSSPKTSSVAVVVNKKTSRSPSSCSEQSRSSSSERSQSSSSERSRSTPPKIKTNDKSFKKKQGKGSSKARAETSSSKSSPRSTSIPKITSTTTHESSTRKKGKRSNDKRLPSKTRSTPILKRLRVKANGRTIAPLPSPTTSSHVVSTATKTKKNKAIASGKKRAYSSENQENDENTPVVPIPITSAHGGVRSKRMKK